MNFANEDAPIQYSLRCAKRNAEVFRKRAPRASQRRGYSIGEHQHEHEQDEAKD
jgi:hypothetical protein